MAGVGLMANPATAKLLKKNTVIQAVAIYKCALNKVRAEKQQRNRI